MNMVYHLNCICLRMVHNGHYSKTRCPMYLIIYSLLSSSFIWKYLNYLPPTICVIFWRKRTLDQLEKIKMSKINRTKVDLNKKGLSCGTTLLLSAYFTTSLNINTNH